ncbi:hypothetical protein BC937DRAFT_88410 [Endogone sp. FLAS-F59071]|nr:hypothetical protein BC937DRAFT_88410 [Endogone sp. FLAS-F59071]|eukprot:RUS18726.1 hypothetical protein BC937DRAFT_88410 [Endogone sp. FLAS-F59071]
MSAIIIKLSCLINFHPIDHVFSIKVLKNGTVDDIRSQVKAKEKTLAQFDINDLRLWRVNIPLTCSTQSIQMPASERWEVAKY